jgi:hypothetical protein
MLANQPITAAQSGTLSRDAQLPATFRNELLAFVADQLPRWRDRPDREPVTAETQLTSQLCAHLNSAARHSEGWDLLQFRREEPDERQKRRSIDLVAAPCGVTLWVEGRGYTDFDSLIPVECKRLPIPRGTARDEREYVFSQFASTGGIQRFKIGQHGEAHSFGAMIAYIQESTPRDWHARITGWIAELSDLAEPGWTAGDHLQIERDDAEHRLAVLRSRHERRSGLPVIELVHLWLSMN